MPTRIHCNMLLQPLCRSGRFLGSTFDSKLDREEEYRAMLTLELIIT
jgi:hypothetical protein